MISWIKAASVDDLPLPVGPEINTRPVAGWTNKSVNLRAVYKGYEYTARLRPSGLIRFDGRTYDSPSAAAAAIRKVPTNGWWMWQIRGKNGEWVRLRELRASMAGRLN